MNVGWPSLHSAEPRRQDLPPLPKIRGKGAPQYLEKGTLLNRRFRLDSLIGGGGFGQIFRATDDTTGKAVGVKVEPLCIESPRMVLKQKVLAALNRCHYTPLLYACGSIDNYNYIVMELLGRNLTEIRKRQKNRRLPISMVSRVGIHILSGLQELHNIGHLHRDIKPSNMCVGLGDRAYTVILIDFGMTRQFRGGDGNIRRAREYAAFRGTMRYVSLRVHDRTEQGPSDDVISLYYTLIELAEGELPWRMLTDPEEIVVAKDKAVFEEMALYCPRDFKRIYDHCMARQFPEAPDYDDIIRLLERTHNTSEVESEMDRARRATST